MQERKQEQLSFRVRDVFLQLQFCTTRTPKATNGPVKNERKSFLNRTRMTGSRRRRFKIGSPVTTETEFHSTWNFFFDPTVLTISIFLENDDDSPTVNNRNSRNNKLRHYPLSRTIEYLPVKRRRLQYDNSNRNATILKNGGDK